MKQHNGFHIQLEKKWIATAYYSQIALPHSPHYDKRETNRSQCCLDLDPTTIEQPFYNRICAISRNNSNTELKNNVYFDLFAV